jgi:hypothetical protein
MASRSQDDRGHDTLVVLKAEDVSGQIDEAAGNLGGLRQATPVPVQIP